MATSNAIISLQGNVPAAPFIPTGATRTTLNVQIPGGSLPGGTATGVQSGFITVELPVVADPAAWQASHVYAASASIKDSNGNIQFTAAGGTSGSSAPTWKTDIGDLTTDNSVSWQMIGDEVDDFVAGACTITITQP
jgi:hypothetical protein